MKTFRKKKNKQIQICNKIFIDNYTPQINNIHKKFDDQKKAEENKSEKRPEDGKRSEDKKQETDKKGKNE